MAISSQPPSLPSYTNPRSSDVQSADPDVVLVNPEELPVDVQEMLILQAIGGSELIQIARNNTVDGQKVIYQPIVNIDSFAAQFSPVLIVGNAPTLNGLKASMPINIDSYLTIAQDNPGAIFVGTSQAGKPAIIVELDNLQDGDVIEIASANLNLSSLYQETLIVDGGGAVQDYTGIIDGGTSLGYNVDITVNGGNS